MSAINNNQHPSPAKLQKFRHAFTLVELLVVIAIIGILMGIAIPTIGIAVRTANTTAMRLEVGSLEQGITKYQLEHGDYPPDFSSWAVVQRHYGKVFPRMSPDELGLLHDLLHSGTVYQAAQMDRAEMLFWTLGGYSKDIQRPFTGPGGPLVWVGDGTDTYAAPTGAMTPAAISAAHRLGTNYQINTDRPNNFFEFDTSRLSLQAIDPALPVTGANRLLSNDDGSPGDLFPTYQATSDGAPYIYFDSRTYDLNDAVLGFNGYATTAFGGVRPYLSTTFVPNTSGSDYANQAQALAAWTFVNPDTYQVIAPGLDSNFGTNANTSGGDPLYFQYPTGNGIGLTTGTGIDSPDDLLISSIVKYQESSAFTGLVDNFQQDNLANFAKSVLIDEVE